MPMSFTSSSGAPAVHESSQMRFHIAAPRPGAPVRLVCFPHAGGTAAAYLSWSRALEHAPIEVVAAELPGRSSRSGEPPCTDLDRIAGGFADLVAPFGDRPFALFGHSLGAIVAFEVARRLRDRGRPAPAHLFVSGAFAPQLASAGAPLRFIEGDTVFLEAVAAKYGGVPKIVLEQAELRASLVPALRADLSLTETYAYRAAPPLDCPIAAYAGASDPIVPADGLAAWREQTAAGFSYRLFDGHHFYLNRARESLLADLTGKLADVMPTPGPPSGGRTASG
jgi:medium-chain acyl-[acyl-carrier-protein] hydrolase